MKSVDCDNGNVNKYIKALEAVPRSNPMQDRDFNKIYLIMNIITKNRDGEAMSYAIREKIHEMKNNDGEDILSYICKQNNISVVRCMIDSGLGYIPIQFLTHNYKPKISDFMYYIKQPFFDVNAKDSHNITVLMAASRYGLHEIVKFLITVPKIDINAVDEFNNSALIFACCYGYENIVKLLLSRVDIDLNIADVQKNTALMAACKEGYLEIVKHLLKNSKMDVNAKNTYGQNALIIATKNGFNEIAELLLTIPGIDPNIN